MNSDIENTEDNFEKFINLQLEEQEALLSQWIMVTFAISTTAILFYRMSVNKNDKLLFITKKHISIVSCLMLLVGISFIVNAIVSFWIRTTYILDIYKKNNHSVTYIYNLIVRSRVVYTVIVGITVLLQIYLSLFMIRNIFLLKLI